MVKVVFTTDRGLWHQEMALRSAPENLKVVMLRNPTRAELIANLTDAEYLISERSGVIDAEILQNAPALKLVQRLGSLTFDIDHEAAQRAGIAVCYMPLPGVINVAEHVIMQILAIGKILREVERIALEASTQWGISRRTDEDTFSYNWSKRFGVRSVWESTVGILGMGEIGVEIARRLQGWGCSLLYNKRTRFPSHVEAQLQIQFTKPDEIISRSDYLVNLLPYSPKTDRMLNAELFKNMKLGSFVVSCGSGSIIDETALADAVLSGQLGGAALDTFEWEPLKPDNPLLMAARKGYNILLTPHTAAGTPSSKEVLDHPSASRLQDFINITRHLSGEPLLYRVV